MAEESLETLNKKLDQLMLGLLEISNNLELQHHEIANTIALIRYYTPVTIAPTVFAENGRLIPIAQEVEEDADYLHEEGDAHLDAPSEQYEEIYWDEVRRDMLANASVWECRSYDITYQVRVEASLNEPEGIVYFRHHGTSEWLRHSSWVMRLIDINHWKRLTPNGDIVPAQQIEHPAPRLLEPGEEFWANKEGITIILFCSTSYHSGSNDIRVATLFSSYELTGSYQKLVKGDRVPYKVISCLDKLMAGFAESFQDEQFKLEILNIADSLMPV